MDTQPVWSDALAAMECETTGDEPLVVYQSRKIGELALSLGRLKGAVAVALRDLEYGDRVGAIHAIHGLRRALADADPGDAP